MASTNISLIPAVVEALVEMLTSRAGLAGVKIEIGPPSQDDDATEQIYLDDIDSWDMEHRVLSGGQATVARDETFELPWVVKVRSRAGQSASFRRAFEIHNEVALAVAEDPRLGGVDGLLEAKFTDGSVDFGQAERKATTKITNNLTIKGKLRS